MKNSLTVSVILPVHNGESTLKKTLDSLFAESEKFDELIIIDDASGDSSAAVIKNYLGGRRNYKIFRNEKCLGLAAAYNRGIRASAGDLIVTLHQDVVLENDALEKLLEPFGNEKIVAATHIVSHPMEIWNRYNFWQKCFFARLAGKNFSGIDGKFDCFRRNALEEIGLFDEKHFRTAGEDSDAVWKLRRIGKLAATKAKIIHLHKIDPYFSRKDIVRKQAQYSEAQGALLAHGRIRGFKHISKAFFREILIVSLLIPYINIISLFLIIIYAFKYTGRVYLEGYGNPRIILLPLLNIFLLFVSLVYSSRGIIYGKQRI